MIAADEIAQAKIIDIIIYFINLNSYPEDRDGC
jgi:hypothetical protein